MNLKDIMAISGYPGLYKLVSQAKNGIIVESLTDKKRFTAFASAKVSALEDVAIFTKDAEVPLKEIFSKIYEKEQGGAAISNKTSSPDEMRSYFSSILPEYDRERVYISDIKKVLMWYNTLQKENMLNIPEDKPEEKAGVEEKPEKKAKPKKTGEKPAKKGPPKGKKKPTK